MNDLQTVARAIRSEIDAAMPHILAAAAATKRLHEITRESSRHFAGREIGFALTNLYVLAGTLGRMFDEGRVRRIVATLEAIDSREEAQ